MTRARSSTLQHLQKLAATTVVAVACNNTGYAVVDPMPIPSKCAGTGLYKGTAVWKMGAGEAGVELQLVISLTKVDHSANMTVLESAEIVSTSTDAQGSVTIIVRKPSSPDTTMVRVAFSVTCDAGVEVSCKH